jgi:hypothetical protein
VIKKEGYVGSQVFQKQKIRRRILHSVQSKLADEEMKFYQYFRMSRHQFNYLLQKIEKDLKKKNTTFPEVISPVEKLATTVSAVQVNVIILKNIY